VSEYTMEHHEYVKGLHKQIAELEECAKDHKRLVREIDVLLNGEDGAAKQASLCDIVAQVTTMRMPERMAELEADKAELSEALETVWGAVTYWQGDDWVEDLIAKHKQPAKEQG
jgi:hypothetical protein